jgi:iron complex outermembrane receptor protein
MTLVAGVFDVQKPYFNLDPARVYRDLGQVRHRGSSCRSPAVR